MNEPIQYAQSTLHSKPNAGQLLAIVKRATQYLSLYGRATHDREAWSDSFTFDVTATARDRKSGSETRSVLALPGYVSNGHTSARTERMIPAERGDGYFVGARRVVDYTEAFRPVRGHWSLFGAQDNLRAVLERLPSDAEVAFQVYLDAGTTENHVRATVDTNYGAETGLHTDHLYLHAWWLGRGKRRALRFLIDATTGLHNSARFGGASVCD